MNCLDFITTEKETKKIKETKERGNRGGTKRNKSRQIQEWAIKV